MAGYVMRSAGLAGVHEGPGRVPPDGWYLTDYNPDAHDGRGMAEWAETPERAMVFADQAAMLATWRLQSSTRPLRGDGRPNRPLTSMNVTCEPDPLGRGRLMADVEYLARRLAARGEWRAGPAGPSGVHVVWWPRGQGPGYSGGTGNPFCQEGWSAATLSECFENLERITRPRSRDLCDLVDDALWLAASHPQELADRRRRYVSSWRRSADA